MTMKPIPQESQMQVEQVDWKLLWYLATRSGTGTSDTDVMGSLKGMKTLVPHPRSSESESVL